MPTFLCPYLTLHSCLAFSLFCVFGAKWCILPDNSEMRLLPLLLFVSSFKFDFFVHCCAHHDDCGSYKWDDIVMHLTRLHRLFGLSLEVVLLAFICRGHPVFCISLVSENSWLTTNHKRFWWPSEPRACTAWAAKNHEMTEMWKPRKEITDLFHCRSWAKHPHV